MLREVTLVHLRQSLPLSHRSHLRLNDSEDRDVQVLFVDRAPAFNMLPTTPVLALSMFYYCSKGYNRDK